MAAYLDPVHGDLLDLIRQADRTRDRRARVVVEQCLAQLPHYRGLPESMLADVRRSVRRHLALFYRMTLETGRPLTDADLEYSRRIARQRAKMRELLRRDTPDEDAVMRQADAIGAAETEESKHRLRTMLEIRALLTPAQREILVEIHEERRKHREERRRQRD